MRTTIYFSLTCSAVLTFGCGNSPSNTANNTNAVANAAPSNTPIVVAPSTNTNANSNTNALPKAATTPGIPGAEQIKNPPKPGVTPTPGIPSDEKMRKLTGRQPVKVDLPPPNTPAVKIKRKPGGKIQ